MARLKKDSHPFSIRMDQLLYDRLTDYCQRSGQSKTVAIERAVEKFINEYDEMMQKLKNNKK